MGVRPHKAFLKYLEETYDENESLEIVIQGNDKLNFGSRLNDEGLFALCSALEPYSLFIEDVDLRYNEITNHGAKTLASLLNRSQRLLGLNL